MHISRICGISFASILLATAAFAQVPAQEGTNLNLSPPPQPSLGFYGLPGVMDMPTGEAMPDGQGAMTISSFGGITRTSLSYQFTPRIAASFRYVSIQDWNDNGFDDYRDRNFDIRFLVRRESLYWPSITVGLQDFAGTGINAGEFVAATKTFQRPLSLPGTVKATVGLGWGRLGTSGSIGSLFGANRPVFDPNSRGGEPGFDQWFRGPTAPFAGIEWQVNNRFALKAEYSSDAYTPETSRGVFERKSSVNLGAEYRYSEALRLGAYWMYGSQIGVTAQLQFNPNRGVNGLQVTAPRAVVVRPTRAVNPEAWQTDWAASASAPVQLRDLIAPELAKQGLQLVELGVTATTAELRFTNRRYSSNAIAVGRAARVLARILPPSVETFRIVPWTDNLALSAVTIRRSDLEALEFQPDAANALLAVTGIGDVDPDLPGGVQAEGLFPRYNWSIAPYLTPSYFDPDQPLRFDFGVALRGTYRPAPGWTLSGTIRHRLAGNVADSTRLSNSVLPRVRTDGLLYAQGSDTYLQRLYAQYQWKPSASTYARVSAGYLERMFGGVSGELLWKPAHRRLALGVEANYVKQRDFNGAFGFQDYSVATGHVSAYYQMDNGYLAQVDVGRYLAGDVGATFTVGREFNNGWRVEGFFTLTNVSAEEFGEGSFDKGIRITVPINWFLGKPTKQTISETIRPIQRDGGARLSVPGRLYNQVRGGHRGSLSDDWARVWE
ncbi:MAG: YjbH domain-containing protein [Pseudomonadota bacterium]